MTTLAARAGYKPTRFCRNCVWFRWMGNHRVCFRGGDVRRTLEPDATADFCEHYEEAEP